MNASLIAFLIVLAILLLSFAPVYWVAKKQKRTKRTELIRSYLDR